MADTEVKAAKLLLDRGIRFNIPDAPFFDRIRRKNRIEIRPLRGGTIAEIAVLTIENSLTDNLTNIELKSRLDVISKIIATAVLNDEIAIEREREKLAKRLLWKVPAHVLVKIFRYIESLNEIKDFTTITNYFNRLTKTMMVKRTGQKTKGSQKDGHE